MDEKRRHSQQALKCYFIVQGEGRGHWQQAMTLKKWLQEAEIELVGIAFGKSASNVFPSSFFEECEVPIYFYDAPSFVKDKNGQAIVLFKTILYNLIRFPQYLKSGWALRKQIKALNPDLVLNFYDPIGGWCSWFLPKSMRQVALANQFALTHPCFPKPKGYIFQKVFLQIFNRICAGKAEKWGMSWISLPDAKGMRIFPPIYHQVSSIKKQASEEVQNSKFKIQKDKSTPNHSFILVYMVNYGYGQQVEAWCRENPAQKVICFWNHPAYKTAYEPLPNLRFEPLHKEKFKAAFEDCLALVSSAGFQTVTEALVAQKALRVIPVKGQYEQIANAHFLTEMGLATASAEFNLSDIPLFKMTVAQQDFLFSSKKSYLNAILQL